MRHAPLPLLALAILLQLAGAADAQQAVRRFTVDDNSVLVGFSKNGGFKAGLWTPVLVKFEEDPNGRIRLPVAADGSVQGEITIGTNDNGGVDTLYPQQFNAMPNKEGRFQVLTYTKPAGSYPSVRATVKAGNDTYKLRVAPSMVGFNLHERIYLALGDRLLEMHESLLPPAPPKKDGFDDGFRDAGPHHVMSENNVQNLPDLWFGYQAVDLAVLVTSNEKFLDQLLRNKQSSPQLEALADWVRRGGRLVVSIAPNQREKVHRLLASPAWQPALPPLLPLDAKTIPLERLDMLRDWSKAKSSPGARKGGVGVRLEQNPAAAVLCADGPPRDPLIVRFPHGVGSITLLAFDLKDPLITSWDGRADFWQTFVKTLGPTDSAAPVNNFGMGGWDPNNPDPFASLYDELEHFDTASISFGWVILFIFIYILVVGPLDYIVLKLVFKRLELTWLTFPAVVLTVSLIAYFTAYAVKGQDLKVNKVDLIDIDMRSSLGQDFRPKAATAFGTTWFTIQSPRIQSYTIGIEPVLHNWLPGAKVPAQPIEPTMSWLGRPDYDGMTGRGRGQSGGLWARNYDYAHNAVGLQKVPIPVWTNKSFTASWEAPFDRPVLPFEAKLTTGNAETLVSGTLRSNLAVDLHDVGLVHGKQFYALPNLPKGTEIKIQINRFSGTDLTGWAQRLPPAGALVGRPTERNRVCEPTGIMRNLMFHETVDVNRSHVSSALDWSWRLKHNTQGGNGSTVKEIILVAHVGRADGSLEDLHAASDPRLPTHLWLGQLPGTPMPAKADGDKTTYYPRPKMEGTLVQETYLRVILPMIVQK